MAENKGNKVMRGNDGTVFLNGEELGDLKSINAKATPKFENVEFVGDNASYPTYTGWEGKGSLKFIKTRSTGLKYLGDSLKTGIFPSIEIMTKIVDKTTGKAERVMLKGVVFNELTLVDIEAKKNIEEELGFQFTDYEILELI